MKGKHLIVLIPVLGFLVGFRGDGLSSLGTRDFVPNKMVSVTRSDNGEEPSSTDSILRLWLAPQTVNSTKPIANTFYFWTSVNELDSVEQQKRLLRTTKQDDVAVDVYQYNLLVTQSKGGDAMADHLFSGERQRVRSAWPCYWSMLDEPSMNPGHTQLVQVVLKDSSLIVVFSPGEKKDARWTVFDLKGNTIPVGKALERKQHIAAVFFDVKNTLIYAGPRAYKVREYCRSFILCNEQMIKSWHHGVPGMQAKIINDLDYLLLLHGYFNEGWMLPSQGKKGKIARASWTMSTTDMKMNNFFFATQRFAWMSGVDANSDATKKIIDLLRERWPQQKNPVEKFPGAGR